MKKMALTAMIVLTITVIAFAQKENQIECKSNFSIGTELDLLPYITGGYYGSVVFGYNNFRLRPIYSKANQPKFVLPGGFDKNEMDVYAILFDYFLNDDNNLKGWWIGAGFEYWKNNVRNKINKEEKSFDSQIFTVGGGYTWFITDNIFLNPWCAGHFTIAGDTDVEVGNKNYKAKFFLPEASLKIGIVF
jgi:hypothetical protein